MKRSDGDLVGDLDLDIVDLREGDGTDIKNAKREEDGFISDYAKLAEDFTDLLKRSDGDLIGDLDLGIVDLRKVDSTGVKNTKREEDGFISDYTKLAEDLSDLVKRSDDDPVRDLRVGIVTLGDGDRTGVKNAKREEGGLVSDYASLAEGFTDLVKRSERVSVGGLDVGEFDAELPVVDPDI